MKWTMREVEVLKTAAYIGAAEHTTGADDPTAHAKRNALLLLGHRVGCILFGLELLAQRWEAYAKDDAETAAHYLAGALADEGLVERFRKLEKTHGKRALFYRKLAAKVKTAESLP